MDPKHDGQTRFRGDTRRCSDIEVQTLELVLLEGLWRDEVWREVKELPLERAVLVLWTHRPFVRIATTKEQRSKTITKGVKLAMHITEKERKVGDGGEGGTRRRDSPIVSSVRDGRIRGE